MAKKSAGPGNRHVTLETVVTVVYLITDVETDAEAEKIALARLAVGAPIDVVREEKTQTVKKIEVV